jgi:hypothetical protein
MNPNNKDTTAINDICGVINLNKARNCKHIKRWYFINVL